MVIGMVISTLVIGIIFVPEVSSAGKTYHRKGPISQPNAEESALESVTASEVEYVDGPLAPLYDFLIQKRLFKFCKLLRDAALDEVIVGGTWTVFAPTDASFYFLPGGTLEELQKNPQLLRDFLLYHFVAGDFPSNQIQNEMLVDSVQGPPLRFNIYGEVITVSGSKIIEPDVTFELGRLYIVDRPLYPAPVVDIVSTLQTHYKEFYKLLVDVNLIDYISSGVFTILVPEDEAFDFLSIELKDAIASNISVAERILLNHILPGSLYVGGITEGLQWETVGGGLIIFTTSRGLTFANDIPIISPDVALTNGVIHVVNRVLLPEGIEADCNCKPSSGTKQTSVSQTSKPSFGQTQRPQHGQGPITQRPYQRQTPRPVAGISGQTKPHDRSQSPSPSSGSSGNRPWSPTRTGQTVKSFSPSNQGVTRSPYAPPPVGPQSDDDINSVVGTGRQPDAGQKKPDQAINTRYPPPPRRQGPTSRPHEQPFEPNRQQHTCREQRERITPQNRNLPICSHSDPAGCQNPPYNPTDTRPLCPEPVQPESIGNQTTRTFQSGSSPAPENENYPEQDITSGFTQSRQTDRWSNRQRTPAPRTPQRGPYQTPSTPTNSWQQRKQVTTKQPRTTFRPLQPQRRLSTTRSPYIPSVPPVEISSNEQPFEPSGQQPICRTQRERITSANRNLPVCSDSGQSECQNSPYNPADTRPLCSEPAQPECRDANAPFNPSDNRPLCQSPVTNQNCREIGQPTYVGDRRPLCSISIVSQTGCRDPTSPYNPSDRRPVCRTSLPGTVSPTIEDTSSPQGCRRASEIVFPQDQRPLCPDEPQEDCRSLLERPKPGDRRPVCKVNTQSPKPHKDGINEPKKTVKPQQQPTQTSRRQPWQSTTRTPQNWQSTTRASEDWRPSSPPQRSQTTRTPQSWQTTRSPQSWQKTTVRTQVGKQPQAGDIQTPSHPQGGTFRAQPPRDSYQPQPGGIDPNSQQSGEYPSQPQTGIFNPQTQTGRYPSSPHSGRYPSQPQSGINQPQPDTGSYPSPPSSPQSGSYPSPHSGVNPSQPQSGSYPSPPSSPHSGSYPSGPHSGVNPSQPQSGVDPSQHQSGSYPSQPQSGRYPAQPQLPQTSQPHSGPQPRQPGRPQSGTQTGDSSQPLSGSSGSQPHLGQGQFQPGRVTTAYPQRQPGSHQTRSPFTTQGISQPGSGDVRPGHTLAPQGQGHQTGTFTTTPRRPVTATTRVPVPVIGTSTTPGEDSRRTLYEIVEDPALLIRGRPIKLTKIFALFHKAGLEDILLGPGPTTVFLPSDDAFSALPKGVVEQLEENADLLKQVLSYHITKTEVLPSAQGESYSVPSLEGTQLIITMLNGGRLILISGAKAVAVTRANNGIFYVINQLLYPLPHHDIVGAIQSRPDLSTLAWLLPQSGLTELLQGEAPHTLLAPTDNAFAQLSPVAYEELTTNTTALREILLNHVIDGAHYGREFFNGGTFPSARGGKLKFQVVSYGYQVNDVNIKTPEIVTGTGVIHLVDQILLEDYDLGFFTNLENSVIGEDGSLSNAQQPAIGGPQQGIDQSGVRQVPGRPILGAQQTGAGQPQIGGLQPSIGAPVPVRGVAGNQRTNGQPQITGQIFGNQPQNNVGSNRGQQIPGRPDAAAFGGRRQPTHGTGQQAVGQAQSHDQSRGAGNTCVGCNQPSPHGQSRHSPLGGNQRIPTQGQRLGTFAGQRQPGTQTGGSGGPQVHGTVQSGGQPSDVADLARSMGLNQFANWISNTGLLEKIHDGGVYTVFAPTDDAVNSLPEDMVDSIGSNPQQVKSILQYHIIPQRVNLNSVRNEETTSTLLQGKTIRFNVYQNSQPDCKQLVTASGTPVGEALATMGSIQVIPVTQVLYQPTGSLLKIVEASPILQQLKQAVKSANLAWILSGTGPVTIFAPSDTAFQSLTDEERKTLIENKQAFSDLLKRHMVRGTLFSSGIQDDVEKRSENNKPIKLSLQEGILTVNSIPVTYADITATNGVLHVIDHFL